MKKDKGKRKRNYPDCYFESVIGKEGCAGYTRKLLAGGDCCEKCRYFMGDRKGDQQWKI